MREIAFIKQNKAKWLAFEESLKSREARNPDEMQMITFICSTILPMLRHTTQKVKPPFILTFWCRKYTEKFTKQGVLSKIVCCISSKLRFR